MKYLLNEIIKALLAIACVIGVFYIMGIICYFLFWLFGV